MKKKIHDAKRGHRLARKVRVAKGMARSDRPRLTIYRSAKHIYAQLVDGTTGRTLGTASTRSKAIAGESGTGNVEAAKKVGKAIAEIARQKEIEEVVFNRNGFLYHGRIRALAEAARENGLRF
jgi:large subunit ribosomal protein L18